MSVYADVAADQGTNETEVETEDGLRPCLIRCWGGVFASQMRGGCGIRTREGLPPTRFPSVRPRPLGESSATRVAEIAGAAEIETTSQCQGGSPSDSAPTMRV